MHITRHTVGMCEVCKFHAAWPGMPVMGRPHEVPITAWTGEKGVFWKKYIQWMRGLSDEYRPIIYSIACSMFLQVQVWQMWNLWDARREPLLPWEANHQDSDWWIQRPSWWGYWLHHKSSRIPLQLSWCLGATNIILPNTHAFIKCPLVENLPGF